MTHLVVYTIQDSNSHFCGLEIEEFSMQLILEVIINTLINCVIENVSGTEHSNE